ncbi:MAG TPA: HAMP domain-containing methyl-accepting chemotaxis protein [Termitinemataceae bacterium]|nr:HAMP domain-containing methyl-accepting chemotaxis protein [Termitinemataceae bacterium]HOM22741.1 HAMP domain-containing methyl-accepting chemotaxis protein [Termitinemataceae bacterium]HPQ00858.1 HAMP domain-containing methyl-accepting chemotaxis protein [Termitinemataceae bacterium]
MRIFGKLLSGIVVIIIALGLVITYIGFETFQILHYNKIARDTTHLIYSWTQVLMGSYQFLTTNDSLEVQEQRFAERISSFEDSLTILSREPALTKLGEEAQRQIENTLSLWEFTKTNINKVNIALEDFKKYTVGKYPSIAKAGTDGIQGEMERLFRSNQIDFSSYYYYDNLRRALYNVALANDGFNKLLKTLEQAIENGVAQQIQRTVIWSLVVFIFAIGLSLLYTIVFSRRLARRTQIIEEHLRALADRDFTRLPPSLGKDEIGQIASHLTGVIQSINRLFISIQQSAKRVTALKESLSAGTTETAAALNQINKNIESIKNQFELLDSSIQQASSALEDIGAYLARFKDETVSQTTSMQEAGENLNRALRAVQEVSENLNRQAEGAEGLRQLVVEGSEKVQNTNDTIKSVYRDVQNIAEIITLIDQISEQTNILSMNAAIESAHAGEAGAGFAVVAEEIRKLAESTQENAQRIEQALTAITTKINEALTLSTSSASFLDTLSKDASEFVHQLEAISKTAASTSQEARSIGEAIQDSIRTTQGYREGTTRMYQQHQAIQDAMENIQMISQETLRGISEIEVGSREILESMSHVEALSIQSREGAEELERALQVFKITQGSNTPEENAGSPLSETDPREAEIDERGVQVKRPPISIR